jgi:hypothetical protein
MRTWTWANLLRCPSRERAPSQTAPRTPLIDAAAAGLIAHPAKDSERSGPAPSPSAGPSAGCPAPTAGRTARRCRQASGSRAASAASSGPKTGAAASRLALDREIAASAGYAQLACLNAAARPGTTFRLRRSRRWRCGSCPGTKVDQARITDVLAGLGELPAHPDALLAVRLPAWPHRWQSRRTVGDRHLLGDHRFHQHLDDVGGVAAEEHDLRLRLHRSLRKAHGPAQRSP